MAEIKISCSHCGQHIQCDESYGGRQINCPSCSHPLHIPQIMQAEPLPAATPVSSAAPILGIKRRQRPDYLAEANEWEGDATENESSETPALWNPRAAIFWSLIFNPAFGAFLHAKNADALGRSNEARTNWIFFYLTLILMVATGVIASIFSQITNHQFWLAWMIYNFFWANLVGWKQAKYVKETLQNNYQRRSWLVPLSIAFGIIIPLMFAASYNSFSKAKQIAENEQQQAGQENLESEVKADIQSKFAQDPATSSTQIKSFHLVHGNGNNYNGTLEAQTGQNNEIADVEVTYDGRSFMWKILPKTTTDNDTQNQNSSANNSVQPGLTTGIDPTTGKSVPAVQVFDQKTGKTGLINPENGLPLDFATKQPATTPPLDPATGLPVMPSDLEWNKDNDDPLASGNYKIAWNKLEAESNLKSLAKETGINDLAVMAKSPKEYIGKIYGISGVVYWVDRKNDLTTIKAFWLDENKNKTDILYMTPNTYDGFHNGDLVNFYGYFVGKGMGNESIMLVGNKAVLLQKLAQ